MPRSIDVDAIPQELKERMQWVCWREQIRDGIATKVPYNPRDPDCKAKSNDPNTWASFEKALEVAGTDEMRGIGFMFSEADPFTGIDLDDCRNPETGRIEAGAWKIIHQLNSYTEISPSGRGVHVLVKANLPSGGGKRRGKVEIYDRGRYFTITGHSLEGTPTIIEDRQDELMALHSEIFGQKQTPSPKDAPSSFPALDLSDTELINKAHQAANGEKFGKLWRGDLSEYDGDDSRADMALCGMLAFWTGPDAARIDRLFRGSGLYQAPERRKKWDRPTGESTYGAKTIRKALSQITGDFASGQESLEERADQMERGAEACHAAHANTHIYKHTRINTRELSSRVNESLRTCGFREEEITYVVNIIDKSQGPKDDTNLAAVVREWVLSSNGDFNTSDIVKELGLSSESSRKNLSKILARLVNEDVIEREGPGRFRRIERESQEIDFLNADISMVLDIRWPFQLERYVDIYPKNIIVVAGDSNAGKTALLLNVVRLNMHRHRVIYFSSEMGPEELRLRLDKFQIPINEWKFAARERASNFSHAIYPEAVNIIDYLELTDDFYKVGGEIKAVFDRLTTGIAIIALQKKEGKVLGRGGDFSLEKARLYLSMDAGELTIVKGKNWAKPGVNPKGMSFKFKLADGCRFKEIR